ENEVDSERSNVKIQRQKYNQAILQEGELKARKQAYDEKVQQRSDYIREAVESFGLSGYEDLETELTEPSSKAHTRFRTQLNVSLEKVSSELEKERGNAKNVENDFNKQLQEVTTKKLREEQARTNARETIRSTNNEIQELKSAIENVTTDESTLSYEKTVLEELQKKLSNEKKLLQENVKDEEISSLNAKISRIDEEIEGLNKKLAQAN